MVYTVKTVFDNGHGVVKAITENELIVIDDEAIPINNPKSQRIMDISKVDLGDSVEYNTNSATGELIYLRVLDRAPKIPPSAHGESVFFGDRDGNGESESRIFGYYVGGGEMANMTLASHDPYDEWADGDTM